MDKNYINSMSPRISTILLSCLFCILLLGCGQSGPKMTLHQAVEKGDLAVVQQHIAAKTGLNKKDYLGRTPLHIAAMRGQVAIAQALMEAGADLELKRKDGKTPLEVAQENGQTAIVQLLQAPKKENTGGRGLIDGGLGVSGAMDGF